MLKEKILSIVGHVTNKHCFEQNKKHICCSHGVLSPEDVRTRPFLHEKSFAAAKLEKALKGYNNSRYSIFTDTSMKIIIVVISLNIVIAMCISFQTRRFAYDGRFYTYW